jgi:hypothetical protein
MSNNALRAVSLDDCDRNSRLLALQVKTTKSIERDPGRRLLNGCVSLNDGRSEDDHASQAEPRDGLAQTIQHCGSSKRNFTGQEVENLRY